MGSEEYSAWEQIPGHGNIQKERVYIQASNLGSILDAPAPYVENHTKALQFPSATFKNMQNMQDVLKHA